MLKTSGVDFVACDNSQASPLTLDILAAVSEDEVRRISVRTREALAAYKARGGRLGASLPQCNKLSAEARKRGAVSAGLTAKRLADEAYSDIATDISQMRRRGMSLREIAAELNREGHTTRRDRSWNPVQVQRVLERSGD